MYHAVLILAEMFFEICQHLLSHVYERWRFAFVVYEGRGDAEVNDALVEGSAGDHTKRTESYVCFEAPLSAKFMDTAVHKVRDYAQYTLLYWMLFVFWFI